MQLGVKTELLKTTEGGSLYILYRDQLKKYSVENFLTNLTIGYEHEARLYDRKTNETRRPGSWRDRAELDESRSHGVVRRSKVACESLPFKLAPTRVLRVSRKAHGRPTFIEIQDGI